MSGMVLLLQVISRRYIALKGKVQIDEKAEHIGHIRAF